MPAAPGIDLAAVIRERLAEQQRAALQQQQQQPLTGLPGLPGTGGLPMDVLARLIESQRAAAEMQAQPQVPAGNQMAMQLLAMMQAAQQGQQQGR